MTTGPSGPHLVDRIDPVPLAALWTAVTRAGGAVGFPADAPAPEIRAAADTTVADVAAGRLRALVIGHDPLVGAVFLRPGAGPRIAHRADVLRLMVDPAHQGQGLGRALLAAVAAHATVLGLDQLLLSARGGTDLPAFYAALGWTEVGVFPGALQLRPGDLRDEHWFQLRLP